MSLLSVSSVSVSFSLFPLFGQPGVAPKLRAFQELNGKVSLNNTGNYDESFLDLCKYASSGVFLVPNDGTSVQVVIPFERSPHFTILIFTIGGKLLRVLVGIIGVDGVAPHPFHLSLVKDKSHIGLWQSLSRAMCAHRKFRFAIENNVFAFWCVYF